MVEMNGVEALDDDSGPEEEVQVTVDKSNFKHLLSGSSPSSKTAFIVIELNDPGRNFKAGEKIEGSVRVLVEDKFNASAVALRLYGVEKASFIPTVDGKIKENN